MSIDRAKHESLAEELLPELRHFVGGDWSTSAAGGSRPHVNPTTARVQATISLAGEGDVDDAVDAAQAATTAWRDLPPHERRSLLVALARLIEENGDQLATIMTLETGLPLSFTKATSLRGADSLEYNASVAATAEGQVIQANPAGSFDYVLPEPYGVVALIMTWNGGVSALGRKAGAALAAGNTVVIKPSELAPFSAVRFAELALEAGFPAGVINVVHGDGAVGDHLVRASAVRKVSFTGGVGTARRIQASAAVGPKPVAFELGGKSANIIFADADIDGAARSAAGAFFMSGQGCVLPTRLLVHVDVYDQVLDRVRKAAAEIPVGDPLDPGTAMGPIITERDFDRLIGSVEKAVAGKEAELTMGGKRLDHLRPGHFMGPTILERVDPHSYVATEELFGPVLTAFPFKEDDEAVELANDSEYGLSAYVQTRSLDRAHAMARRLEVGNVSINGFQGNSSRGGGGAPFGGVKASGFGREGGKAGVDEFLTLKNVVVGLS